MKKLKIQEGVQVQIKGISPIPGNPDLPTNENIPTLFSDIMNFIYNPGTQLGLISFFSRAQGKNVEQCRVSVHTSTLKQFIDIMCLRLNYYPKPPKK